MSVVKFITSHPFNTFLVLCYLTFACWYYDAFNLVPMIICIFGGLIAGYSDHANLCQEKKYTVKISVGAVILLVLLLAGFFVLDFSFLVNLILGTLLAISLGAIISLLFNDINKSQMANALIDRNIELEQSESTLRRQTNESQQMLDREKQNSANLKQKMEDLHHTLLESKKNESVLIDKFQQNEIFISELSQKNKHLEVEIAEAKKSKDKLDFELEDIKNQKNQSEAHLAELKKVINRLSANLKNLENISIQNTAIEDLLLERQQALKQQLEDVHNTAKLDSAIKSKLENDLNAVSKQLVAHKTIQDKNNLELERAKADLKKQTTDKAELENAYNILQTQQERMVSELQQTNQDKENLEKELDSSRNSIKWQIDKNTEYRKQISELENKNKELEQKENFLNAWIDIEIMMKNYNIDKTKTSENYINEYFQKKLFSTRLKNKLHTVRIKRNEYLHEKVKVSKEDLENVVYCFNEVKKALCNSPLK